MTLELSRDAEQFIKQQLATGQYADEGEVVTQALHLWQQYQKKAAEIHAGVQRGIEDMEAGRYTKISNSDEAQALANDIKQRGRALEAKRKSASQ